MYVTDAAYRKMVNWLAVRVLHGATYAELINPVKMLAAAYHDRDLHQSDDAQGQDITVWRDITECVRLRLDDAVHEWADDPDYVQNLVDAASWATNGYDPVRKAALAKARGEVE